MFKKLSNLLFEEDDDELIVDDEPVVEVKTTPTPAPVQSKPRVSEPPVFEKKESTMNRIDVTQPIQTHQEPEMPVFKKPEPVYTKPIAEEAPVETKRPTLGISIDEVTSTSAPAQPNPVVKKPAVSSRPAAKPARKSSVYEFSPIISPFYGVDEKDASAVLSGTKNYTAPTDDRHVSRVISPINGMGFDGAKPIAKEAAVETVSRENTRRVNEPTEKIVPEFSLDDILNNKTDDEPAKEQATFNSIFATDEEDDIDTTVVIDSRKYGSSKKGE